MGTWQVRVLMLGRREASGGDGVCWRGWLPPPPGSCVARGSAHTQDGEEDESSSQGTREGVCALAQELVLEKAPMLRDYLGLQVDTQVTA